MRILLVEDEPRLAASIVRGLAAEGFAVDHADAGTDGLWRAREGAYAAIILDIMLPGMNGYEICRTLRDEGDTTPIMMLTAKDGEYDEAEGFDTGADDWVTKPFSFVALVARLRALIRRTGAGRGAQPQLIHGDLRLDPATRSCRRGDEEIELTAREFDIVELLLRNGGEVVTRRDLLDEVWGIDFEGDPNVLDVYIGYVRKKIDKPFERNTLKTVRGIGYRLMPA